MKPSESIIKTLNQTHLSSDKVVYEHRSIAIVAQELNCFITSILQYLDEQAENNHSTVEEMKGYIAGICLRAFKDFADSVKEQEEKPMYACPICHRIVDELLDDDYFKLKACRCKHCAEKK
jgi:hypothetical protein